MLPGAGAFTTVAQALVNAIVAALTPKPGRYGLVPGAEIAWDVCDCDGQLAVAITRVYPSSSFPIQASGRDLRGGRSIGCGPPLRVAELSVQLARCAPVPDEGGNPPTAEALRAATVALNTDAWRMWKASVCALNLLKAQQTQPNLGIDDWFEREQVALGPEGGCVAIEQRWAVSIDNLCPDCP